MEKSYTPEKILLGYDPLLQNLLPALKAISAAFGYVSEIDAQKSADYFEIPLSKVYETATFYDLINTIKQPSLTIKVCFSTNCALSGSSAIIKEIEKHFHIKAEDENNPRIKLEIVSCMGMCGEGPIVVVNEKIYKQVTTDAVHGILTEWM